MAPGVLASILDGLPSTRGRPEVLVGLDPGDDAAVYRLDDERAVVATVDVITPIVDDPATFGRIAATNSICDIHAMGARPLFSLSVACFAEAIGPGTMATILEGAADVALGEGAPILGGHTIKDSEVKFGLAVVGEVHPDRMLLNSGAAPGEALVITKAVGSAALATAFKQGAFDEADGRYTGMVESMLRSNREAARIARDAGSRCATDITGFGIAGHLLEVARASETGIELELDRVPILDGAARALAEGHTCGGARANRLHAAPGVSSIRDMEEDDLEILWDPQTSGPLVFSVRAEIVDSVVGALREAGYAAATRIGWTTDDHCGSIRVS